MALGGPRGGRLVDQATGSNAVEREIGRPPERLGITNDEAFSSTLNHKEFTLPRKEEK